MSYQLIVYEGGGVVGDIGSNSDNDNGGGVGGNDSWAKRTDSALDLASDIFSGLNIFPL